jgi:hypothetical protein
LDKKRRLFELRILKLTGISDCINAGEGKQSYRSGQTGPRFKAPLSSGVIEAGERDMFWGAVNLYGSAICGTAC